MPTAAAIFDLDRTLLRSSSTPVIQRHLRKAGLANNDFPGERLFQIAFELFGESSLAMRVAKGQSGAKAGWSVDQIAEVGQSIADELLELTQPFVASILDMHRNAGRKVVIATGSNLAPIQAYAERLGIEDVIATRWAAEDDVYTGELDGARIHGTGKLDAVKRWADEADVDLSESYFYTDSRFDIDLLEAVGHPVAVNPDIGLAAVARQRGWPIRFLDKPEGVVKIAGRELQDWLRPLSRPERDASAKFVFEGVENIPASGGAIIVFNHRSYFDSSAVGYLLAKSGRNARFLGKKEVFDVPIAGAISKAMGGIRVDRGTGSSEPLQRAADALLGGEVISLAPQGTIPRGPAFFDPELKGRWGAARLAQMTGAPVIPVGLWGTEKVWPRSARIPRIALPGQDKPTVTVTVGEPFAVEGDDPEAGTKQIMDAIVALLPDEARQPYTPTEKELARTYPAGYSGTPEDELDRRPGTDT